MSTQAKIQKILTAGFSNRVIQTLGVLQGTSTTAFFTAADVTRHILNKTSITPTTVTKTEYNLILSRVGTVLNKGVDHKHHNLVKADRKIATTVDWVKGWPSKVAMGYRIGATISIPVINSDIQSERKAGIALAAAFNESPMECIKDIMPKLTDAQLTDVILEALSLKDARLLETRNELVNTRRNADKVKSNAETILETALTKLKSTEE